MSYSCLIAACDAGQCLRQLPAMADPTDTGHISLDDLDTVLEAAKLPIAAREALTVDVAATGPVHCKSLAVRTESDFILVGPEAVGETAACASIR